MLTAERLPPALLLLCVLAQLLQPGVASGDTGYDLGVSPFGVRLQVASIEPGDTVAAALAGGASYAYVMPAGGNRVFSMDLTQKGQGLEATVVSADGELLFQTHCADNVLCSGQLLFSAEPSQALVLTIRAAPASAVLQYTLFVKGSVAVSDRARLALDAFAGMQTAESLFASRTRASLEQALAAYSSTLVQWQRLQDQQGEAETLCRIGDTLGALGRSREAIDSYTRARAVFHQLRIAGSAAYMDVRIGEAMIRLADAPAALERLNGALAFFTEAANERGQARVLHDLGLTYYNIGDPTRALEYYRRSLDLWRSMGDHRAEALTLMSAAAAHAELKEAETAMGLYREVLSVLQQMNDSSGQAAALNGMALMYNEMGEYQKALDSCFRALSIRRPGDAQGQALTLDNLGLIYQNSGDLEKAYAFYQEALLLRRQAGDTAGEAATMNNLGQYYREIGDFRKALESFQQSYALIRWTGYLSGEATALRNIAQAELGLQDAEAAARDSQAAREIFAQLSDQSGEASCISLQAKIALQRGNLDEALKLYQDALSMIRPAGDRPGEASMLLDIARIQRSLHRRSEAATSVEESIRILESIRSEFLSHSLRVSYLSAGRDAYEFYVSLLYEMHLAQPDAGYAALAFRVSEGARARTFSDLLSESLDKMRTEGDPARPSEERPPLPAPVRLADVQQQLLEPNTVLLEFLTGKEESYAWAVTKTDCLMYPIPHRQELQQGVERMYQYLRSSDPDAEGRMDRVSEQEFWKLAADLGQQLLGPAASLMEGNRILISGDSALQYLPFSVLSLPGTATPIGVDHQLVYLPSATSLLLLRKEARSRTQPRDTLAVLADPVFDPADPRIQAPAQRIASPPGALSLSRIPFTRREAQAILQLAPGESYLATDSEASRQTLESAKIRKYRYIHIATHGILDTSNPESSGLVLSLYARNGALLPGLVTTADIFSLNLSADLVVLSGCSTALGKDVRGEGLSGMVRAFLYAGTQRVLASFWSVQDAATVELMTHFYSGIFKRKLSPAAALQETQRYMWNQKRWKSPYYWAAFMLSGEYR